MPRPHRLLHMGSRTVSAGVDVAVLCCLVSVAVLSAGRLLGGKTFWNPHACGGASSAASRHLQEGKPQLLGTRAWNIPQAECVSQSSSEWSLGLFTFVSETMRDTRRLLQS